MNDILVLIVLVSLVDLVYSSRNYFEDFKCYDRIESYKIGEFNYDK